MTRLQVQKTGTHFIIPGLASAHSHAFQRALRGRTQRKAAQAGSFWSWRGLMYHLAEQLDPEAIYALARFAFVELAMSGVTAVGEFHYVHHDRHGRPYADRLAMSAAVIEAAREAGIRLTLIRAAYLRGGYQQELAPAQRRFVDPDIALVLQDIAALQSRYGGDSQVNIALAAHSIRAVPLAEVVSLAGFAREREIPFHMHVAEQRRELDECLAEYGQTPAALLAEAGVLSPRFVAVHATHLTAAEIRQLGQAGAMVCLCRTTERDLGDGLPAVAEMRAAGVRLCVGADSHCAPDAFEEIRAVELDDRSRTEQRTVAATAPDLLAIGTEAGYAALGLEQAAARDAVHLRADDAALAGAAGALLADHVIFGATARAVDQVFVGDNRIVEQGQHVIYEEAHREFTRTVSRIFGD